MPSLDPIDQVKSWFQLLSFIQAKPKEISEAEVSQDESVAELFEGVPSEALIDLLKKYNGNSHSND